jgi:hypothetical protein
VAGGLDVGQVVGDADDGLSAVRHLAEELHHVAVGLLVEAGCDFIQKQQAGTRDQFVCQARPLRLPAAQMPDQRLTAAGQSDNTENFGDAGVNLPASSVRREPQLGGKSKGITDRQRIVQYVFLRDDRHVVFEGVEVGVEVLAVDGDAAAVGRIPAAENCQQR